MGICELLPDSHLSEGFKGHSQDLRTFDKETFHVKAGYTGKLFSSQVPNARLELRLSEKKLTGRGHLEIC